jgi:hypothetical protein
VPESHEQQGEKTSEANRRVQDVQREGPASLFEELSSQNGCPPQWKDNVYDSREALGFALG